MDPYHHHHLPSFSSSLLDQIYRSIDDSSTISDVSMIKKHHHNRRPTADERPVFFKHSSSSSSDSSGGFSFSDSDSFYSRSRSSRSPPVKPIRTTVVERSPHVHRPNNKQEHGSFLRTKSKALKIYTDLKKVKQPISPGGRLAAFMNSLFTGGAGNTKKPTKVNKANTPSAASTTTCSSSASSFSRSCLSKTSSSSEKSKRSVRFCPVNVVILDEEDSKRESSRLRHRDFDVLDTRVMEENRRVIEAAKELLRSYKKNRDVVVNISGDDDDDDDDDAVSCASSDLFELENLSAIGIERYREELPVYETTRLDTSRLVSR